MSIDWVGVWTDVADRLRADVDGGLGHLLTEDAVRWRVIDALAGRGVSGDRIAAEVAVPVLRGGLLDLTVDRDVVELKFPRLPRNTNPPYTQILGALLRDFQRVAIVDANERWVVQVYPVAVEAYLRRLEGRLGIVWPMGLHRDIVVTPALMVSLPASAGRGVPGAPESVAAECRAAYPIGGRFALYAYAVDMPGPGIVQRVDVP